MPSQSASFPIADLVKFEHEVREMTPLFDYVSDYESVQIMFFLVITGIAFAMITMHMQRTKREWDYREKKAGSDEKIRLTQMTHEQQLKIGSRNEIVPVKKEEEYR
jgi:hypothetical protein